MHSLLLKCSSRGGAGRHDLLQFAAQSLNQGIFVQFYRRVGNILVLHVTHVIVTVHLLQFYLIGKELQ